MNRPVSAQLDSLIESCTGQLIIFSSARCFDPDGDQFTTEWDFGDGSLSKESNLWSVDFVFRFRQFVFVFVASVRRSKIIENTRKYCRKMCAQFARKHKKLQLEKALF